MAAKDAKVREDLEITGPSPSLTSEAVAAAVGGRHPTLNTKPLFKLMVEKKASDLFFTSNAPIKIKIEGQILPVNKQVLTPETVRQTAYALMSNEQREHFQSEWELDFAVSEPGLGRFRVNVFMQRGYPAMVMRYITADMPRLETLSLPDAMGELILLKRGLILMVGATGSGKSTTLAAMINHRNECSSDHIVTIEDPIEFLHTNKRSLVNQREVGLDTKSYARALRGVVRAAPDVILIGEVRDRDGMEAAINLSGTGHLVLATMHANNCAESLDRMINMFPREQHAQIFLDLSQYLRAIMAQRLVMGKDGRRCRRGGDHDQHPAHRDPREEGRRGVDQGSHQLQQRQEHPELRRGLVRAVQGRAHHPGRGARQRRLARQPRSQDQLRLSHPRAAQRALLPQYCQVSDSVRLPLPR